MDKCERSQDKYNIDSQAHDFMVWKTNKTYNTIIAELWHCAGMKCNLDYLNKGTIQRYQVSLVFSSRGMML